MAARTRPWTTRARRRCRPERYVAVDGERQQCGGRRFWLRLQYDRQRLDNAAADNVRSRQGSLDEFIKNANAIGSASSHDRQYQPVRIPVGSLSGEVTFITVAALPSLAD